MERLQPRRRFGVAAQTTQPIERVRQLGWLIRRRFPLSEVRVVETTVCVPTRLRQEAAEALAAMSDVVVVVGGARSNNTRELCATCRQQCERVFLVQGARDLRPEWFAGRAWGASPPAPPRRTPSSTASKPPCRTSRRGGWREGNGCLSDPRDPRGRADDWFYQLRRLLWLPPEMTMAPVLDRQPRPGPVEPRTALLVNPFYPKSPHGSFGKHVLTPSSRSRRLRRRRRPAARPLLGREPAARPTARDPVPKWWGLPST